MLSTRSLLLICLIAALPSLVTGASLEQPPVDSTLQQRIDFYIKRLGDPKYVEYRQHDDTKRPWYVAAEELGLIGSPAVAPLIERLRTTTDSHERTLTFYALVLAAQAPEINAALGQTIPDHPFAWPPEQDHARLKKLWLDWWAKYGATVQKVADQRARPER